MCEENAQECYQQKGAVLLRDGQETRDWQIGVIMVKTAQELRGDGCKGRGQRLAHLFAASFITPGSIHECKG
jgi:hypothetical protein